MNNKQKLLILMAIVIIVIFGAIVSYVNSHHLEFTQKTQITDMAGRNVGVPNEVNRVASVTYSVTVLVYMLAPDKLIAWNSNQTAEQNKYIPAKYQNLPVAGGGKGDANYESFLVLNPDLAICGHAKTDNTVNIFQQKFGEVPVLDVEGENNITNIVPAIKFLGVVLGEQQKAEKLITFYNNVSTEVNNTVAQIPENEKKRVYYARDSTGLQTDPLGGAHTQLIGFCGGVNVAQVQLAKGTVQVSMEQVLAWNPDVIISSDSTFYGKVYSDPAWQNIKAVQDKQVYLVPNSPFNWFETPPGANSIIGIAWTAKVLYPDRFNYLDLKNLTKEFYSDFYHYNLSDTQVSEILSSSGLKQF